ncbi:MAG: hypothetical protein K2K53_06490 [Oscillospiraceae bacterium]|nr:hypothetical protein [Oscillospiraceae bacterium]
MIEGPLLAGRSRLAQSLAFEARLLGFRATAYTEPPCDFECFDEIVDYINGQFHVYRHACRALATNAEELVFLDGWFYSARARVESAYRTGVLTKEEYDKLLFLMNTLLVLQPWFPELIVMLNESTTRCMRNGREARVGCLSHEAFKLDRFLVAEYNLLTGKTFEVTSGTLDIALDRITRHESFGDVLALLCPKEFTLRPTMIDPKLTDWLNAHRALAPHVCVTGVHYRETANVRRPYGADGTPVLRTVLNSIAYKVPRASTFCDQLERNREVMNLLSQGDYRHLRVLSCRDCGE